MPNAAHIFRLTVEGGRVTKQYHHSCRQPESRSINIRDQWDIAYRHRSPQSGFISSATLRLIFTIFAAIISCFMFGCAKKQIEGQAFIVTSQRDNIKLGLLTVGVYSQEYIDSYITEKQIILKALSESVREIRTSNEAKIATIQNELSSWENDKSALVKQAAQVSQQSATLALEGKVFSRDFAKLHTDAVKFEQLGAEVNNLSRMELKIQALEALKIRREELNSRRIASEAHFKENRLKIKSLEEEEIRLESHMRSGEKQSDESRKEIGKLNQSIVTANLQIVEFIQRFFEGVHSESALETCLTDADGRFRVCDYDSGVIFASATRMLLESEERYVWVLPRKDWDSLILGNHNLFDFATLRPQD